MLTNRGAEADDSRQSNMRPDTPDLEVEDEAQTQAQDVDAIGVDEMDERLFEAARQASLQQRAQEIATREESNYDFDADEDAGQRSPTDRSQSASPPPAEYDEEGRLTARSKGKGRAD